ncbi:MAG TPA: ATP-binding cassette domain-containing protein [Mycobacteriales bacterium]|nr:ATP-binding cassette domain-containing protein [Mycobacteriales bacterium]
MLTVEALEVAYGRSQVLFGVDLHAPAGALVCVMGRNGVGKTTLPKAVLGVLPDRSRRVTFDGRDITRRGTHGWVRLGLGYVPPGREAFPQLTVWENLLVAAEAAARRADRGAADDALDLSPRCVGCGGGPGTGPAVSSSSSRSPGPWSPVRRCCCWTSRPRASSPRSSWRSRRRCSGCTPRPG